MTSSDLILFGTNMSLIHLVIIFSCWSADARDLAETADCDGWFGPGCKYQCHCQNRCTRDGNCPSGCAKGWFGPQCQYENFLDGVWLEDSLNRRLVSGEEDIGQLSGKTPKLLFDGDESSCLRREVVQIDWNTAIPFTWMRLNFKNHVDQDQVSIKFSKNWHPPAIECGKRNVSIVENGVFDIHCDVQAAVYTILLKFSTKTPLCSVYVSGGRNVALKQITSQTGTYLYLNTYSWSGNAVDGNTNANFDQQSCTHTDSKGQTPSWTVMLSGHHVVNRYRIYNRKGPKNRQRLKGFILTSKDASNQIVFDYQSPYLDVSDRYTVIHEDGVGQQISYVTIEGTHEEKILNLCEVEVFGDSICPIGLYGRDCEHTCNCAERTEACHVSTGGCASGCAPGFTGEGCLAGCPIGFYGTQCTDRCPQNCLGGTCRAGFCNGCQTGWKGIKCDKACDFGTYGEKCSKFCSYQCAMGSCDPVSGACTGGCVQGYEPPNCEDPCKSGFYGVNCASPCSTHCTNAACASTNGTCSCVPGYAGDTCDQECPPKLYGTGCKLSCDTSCLDQLCNNVNGSCKACSVGKMGERCDQDCIGGKYGLGCNESCGTNCGGDGGCNPVSGHCNYGCKEGYTGERCEKECDATLYGAGCNTNCSAFCLSDITTSNTTTPQRACDHVTGECLKGCQSGYEGYHCLTASPATSGADTGVIVGPLIAVIILAVIMALGVVFWRKRKIRKQKNFIGLATHQNAPEPMISNSKTTVIQAQKTRDPNAYDPTPSGEVSDDVYFNTVTGGRQKTSLSLENLNNYMITHNNAFFEEQFKNIPANVNVSMSVGLSAENKAKNRYKNISAYDHSRVHLISCPEKKHGDYINASFVKDYKDYKRFIASQGPNKVIIEDFIRMLWEQKVEKVVMLTNLIEEGKHKCDQYWPEDGEMQFGEIRVRLVNTQIFADYTIRKLELLKTGETTQQLTHFHFTSWPDKGVPKTAWSLVDFEQRVSLFPSSSPIVVHCSAGVGRTGTFIALHNLIAEAKETGQLDFCTTLWKLRQDRVYMIQTVEQYIFLHKAVQVAMICVDTTVHVSDIIDRMKRLEARSSRGQSNFEKEFKSICTVCADKEDGKDEEGSGGSITGLYHNSRSLNNKLKNRFSNILPKDQYRPFLFCENKDVSDYINAVYVPSLTKLNHQILTQLPLPTTVVDFWRLVTQYRVTLIVAFELDLKEADSTIGSYLPANMSEPMTCGNINVEAGPVNLGASWEEQNISITVQKRKKSLIPTPTTHSHFVDLSVTHLKYTSTVYNTEKFLAFLSHARSCSAHQGKVLYTCRNGADMSGLACVLSLLLDRIDNDHYLTVPLVVGAVKTIRQQVIPTLDQYKMLYQLVKLYSESGSVYYNLGHANNNKGKTNPAFVSTSDEDRYVYANL